MNQCIGIVSFDVTHLFREMDERAESPWTIDPYASTAKHQLGAFRSRKIVRDVWAFTTM